MLPGQPWAHGPYRGDGVLRRPFLQKTPPRPTASSRYAKALTFPAHGANRERFLTGEAHIEGVFQFNHVSPDAAGLSPYSSVFAVAEARANINLGPYFSINGLLRFDRGQELTNVRHLTIRSSSFSVSSESFTCDHCTFMPGKFVRGSASAGTPLPDCTVAIMTSTTSW